MTRRELTYCTNVHAGEAWVDVRQHLERDVPAVRGEVGTTKAESFAVGLRLSARAAGELASARERERLVAILEEQSLRVVTLNGFPYGAFHGARIKEQVFHPDWRCGARLAYTDRLAELLVDLLPEEGFGSISTVPGGGPDARQDAGAAESIAEMLLRHAAHLHALWRRTGKTVCLALEPEPFAWLETIEEAVTFFEARLLSRDAVRRFARMTRTAERDAEEALRCHLGLCLDACHAAVMWEDARAAFARPRAAGVRIAKVQVSAALEVDAQVDEIAALERFDDGVYLHQAVARDGRRARDLDVARAAMRADGTTWRVHAHVPIFVASIEPFRSTQACLRDVLAASLEDGGVPCYEVETYTWNVLPADLRSENVARSIARELEWARACLAR